MSDANKPKHNAKPDAKQAEKAKGSPAAKAPESKPEAHKAAAVAPKLPPVDVKDVVVDAPTQAVTPEAPAPVVEPEAPAPVVAPTPPPARAPKPTAATPPSADPFVVQTLAEYVAVMMPGMPVSVDAVTNMQRRLFNAMTLALQQPGPLFVASWTAILNFANEHLDDLFSPAYLYRCEGQLKLPPNDLRSFDRLRHLVRLTANPQTRAVCIKQIDMAATLKYLQTIPNAAQNLAGYYKV